jgi:adenylate kinase
MAREIGTDGKQLFAQNASQMGSRLPFDPHRPALLLLGPTGSGKTPLGEELVRRGLTGRRAVHFDFGAQLRRIVDSPPPNLLSPSEVAFLQGILATGALLEDEHFPLALRILRWFASQAQLRSGEWLILNGLPRHRGQAEAMVELVDVAAVAELVCPPEVVVYRIQSNIGGDRQGRPDDELPLVRRKLEIYHTRTRPIIHFYRQLAIPVIDLHVTPTTTEAELATTLEECLGRLIKGQTDTLSKS